MTRLLWFLALGACARPDFEPSFVPHALGDNPCAARLEANPSDESHAEGGLFCNQDDYGGGWLLAAKVFRVRNGGTFRDEPQNFWRQAFNANTMNSKAVLDNQLDGIASHDIRTLPVSQATTLWVELIHATNQAPPKSWFKRIDDPSDLPTWFGPADAQGPSEVCGDLQMTDCEANGEITLNRDIDESTLPGRLHFNGMVVDGSDSSYGLYMDLNGSPSNPEDYSGVCSDTATGENVPPDWPDNPLNNLHWGHGMRIWIR